MAYRTEAHSTDTARNGAESGAHRAEPESTEMRQQGAGSGANREQLAPFAPHEERVVRSPTLPSVIAELWPNPMLRGMPDGTRFDYGQEHDRVWARLTTSWFPTPTVCEITEHETRMRAITDGSSAFARLCDERLSDLRMRHWMAMFWPDLDEVPT